MCGDMGNTCLVSVIGFQCVQIDSHKPVVAEKYIKRAIMFGIGIGLEGNGQLEQCARHPEFVPLKAHFPIVFDYGHGVCGRVLDVRQALRVGARTHSVARRRCQQAQRFMRATCAAQPERGGA